MSKKVFDRSEMSAIVVFASAAAFDGAGTRGLAIRDLVGLGVGVDILSLRLPPPPFLCDRESPAGFSESVEVLVQGQALREQNSILLDPWNACTAGRVAIRGGGRVGVFGEEMEMELTRRGEGLASRVAYRTP